MSDFIETRVLLAALAGDTEDLIELIGKMTTRERDGLDRAFTLASNVISSTAPPSSFRCPNCQARPTEPCTQPTDTGRRPIRGHHAARVDLAERANRA